MNWLFITFSMLFFSVFTTSVMSYIALATPIGPWIMPTVALCAVLLAKIIFIRPLSQSVALIALGSSLGGIIATAAAFSFPTLFFLDPDLFNHWMRNPLFFASVMGGLSFSAGLLGMIVASFFEPKLIDEQGLSFPIGKLTFQLIDAASNHLKKAYELLVGFGTTILFCGLQDGIAGFNGIIPKNITLVPTLAFSFFRIPAIQIELWPMLWAIGFVAGHIIAFPLAIGALSRLLIVDPVHTAWFTHLSSIEFTLAFCSGMVFYGAAMSFFSLPQMLFNGSAWLKTKVQGVYQAPHAINLSKRQWQTTALWALVIAIGVVFLRYFSFSMLSIAFLYLGTIACMQQVAVIAGKYGLAPLGRFATFVMIPAMLVFKLDYAQVVLVATFVEIAVGVVADVLFGRKLVQLMNLPPQVAWFYQFLGLAISSAAIGVVFWLLITHFQLGSQELFAYKAQSRQLLIHARKFEFVVVLLGALFAFILRQLKVNAMLVLGGLLMPINFSLGLVIGGMLTLLVNKRDEWEPFWSGVFASNSLWMLFKAVFNR
jgi:hypothetical protein